MANKSFMPDTPLFRAMRNPQLYQAEQLRAGQAPQRYRPQPGELMDNYFQIQQRKFDNLGLPMPPQSEAGRRIFERLQQQGLPQAGLRGRALPFAPLKPPAQAGQMGQAGQLIQPGQAQLAQPLPPLPTPSAAQSLAPMRQAAPQAAQPSAAGASAVQAPRLPPQSMQSQQAQHLTQLLGQRGLYGMKKG